MLITRNVRIKYMAPQGADGGEGGGGTTTPPAPVAPAPTPTPAPAPTDGERKLTDEEARLLKENMKKKADLAKSQEEIMKLQAALKAFDGIDPEAVRKIVADQKSAEEKQLEAKGDYERLKARMADEHTVKMSELQTRLEAAQKSLADANGSINELSIGSQFGQSKFVSDELTLTASKARVIYAGHFDLVDGKVVGYDKPRGSAARTALVNQLGDPVAFDEAMRKIIDADPEKKHLLRSKTKSGASSGTRDGVEATTTTSGSMSKIAEGLRDLKIVM